MKDQTKKRPFLTSENQVNHLKLKGVKFEVYSEQEAIDYLKRSTNYFKLRAFRTAFPKYNAGEKRGQYLNLDFGYLKDIATIDMRLRYVLIHMALDIEHFSKVFLLKRIEDSREDGYSIVDSYMKSMTEAKAEHLQIELDSRKHSDYCGDLIAKYEPSYPIWVFLEVISFGTLIDFISYCAKRNSDRKLREVFKLLQVVRVIRNAAAHSNCLLNRLESKTSNYSSLPSVRKWLTSLGVEEKWIKARMSNSRIQQITTVFYAHRSIVSSSGVHNRMAEDLHNFKDRMMMNHVYYQDNQCITSSFAFLGEIIDRGFPSD